jgi:orotidine-5'-phosphate decarboxylase
MRASTRTLTSRREVPIASTRPFADRLAAAVIAARSPACVGIDPHEARLPLALRATSSLSGRADAVRAFSLAVVDACAGVVPAVKPQVAFYEALGSHGIAALEDTVRAARKAGLLVVLDAKRGDIGTTAEAYARYALDDDGPLGSDAVTLSPYLGPESLEPFATRCSNGKGAFVLLRTSNPGAHAWQRAGQPSIADGVADWLAEHGAIGACGLGSIGAVVGATIPDEAREWRARLPATWFLVPGYGAQGGDLATVRDLVRPDGLGALVVSARAVLFPASGDDGDSWAARIGDRARAFAAELRAGLAC